MPPTTTAAMSYALGVDLGTTYSAAAVRRSGKAEIVSLGHRATVVPSVVFVPPEGEVLVGEAAVRRGASEPARMVREFKRRMGDNVPLIVGGTPWSADALTARLLKWLVGMVEVQQGGPADRITLTYPATWGPFKQEWLVQAWRMADLHDVTMMTEPVAAATSYAAAERVPVGQVIAVYDLGGGTFDAAVVRKTTSGFELLGKPEGIEHFGGIDVDKAVFAHVQQMAGFGVPDEEDRSAAQALDRLRSECTQAKEALSSDTSVSIPVLIPGMQTEVRLNRDELEAMVRPRVQDSIITLRRTIASAGLTPEHVDRVLLVGGGSRMPLVAQMVTKDLGRPIFIDAQPKHAVALGAVADASTGSSPDARPLVAPPPVPSPAAAPVDDAAPDQDPATETETEKEATTAPTTPPVGDRTDGRPPRHRPTGLLAGVAIGALLAVVVAVVLVIGQDGDPDAGAGATTTQPATTAPPPTPTVAGTTAVAEFPDWIIAAEDGSLWVTSTFGSEVSQLNAGSGAVERRVPLDGEPLAILEAEGSIWVTQRSAGQVARLNPTSGALETTIDVGGQPNGLFAGAGSIWVTGSGRVTRIDPATDTVTVLPFDLPNVTGLVVTDETVWAPYGVEDGAVAVIDPATNEITDEIAGIGTRPDQIALAPSGLWVALRGEGVLRQIDPESHELMATVDVGTAPSGVEVDGDRLWVVDNTDGTLVLVDGPTASVVASIEVGAKPLDLATTPGHVWVSLSEDDTVARVDLS